MKLLTIILLTIITINVNAAVGSGDNGVNAVGTGDNGVMAVGSGDNGVMAVGSGDNGVNDLGDGYIQICQSTKSGETTCYITKG